MGKFSRELCSAKGVEIITRCETLILVTGLAAKHCNHPNYQMESYRSLYRSYENNRSTWHKMSVIFSLNSLKRESRWRGN